MLFRRDWAIVRTRETDRYSGGRNIRETYALDHYVGWFLLGIIPLYICRTREYL